MMEKEKEMEKVQNRPSALALELNMLGNTFGGQALVGERDNKLIYFALIGSLSGSQFTCLPT